MKRSLVLVLVMVLTIAFCCAAYAAKQEFYDFSIDVPAEWLANVDKGEYSVSISAPDGSESITFRQISAEGMDSFSFAQSIANELGGSFPTEDNGIFDFSFFVNDAKINVQAWLMEAGGWGVVMKSDSGFENLTSIMSSWAIVSSPVK